MKISKKKKKSQYTRSRQIMFILRATKNFYFSNLSFTSEMPPPPPFASRRIVVAAGRWCEGWGSTGMRAIEASSSAPSTQGKVTFLFLPHWRLSLPRSFLSQIVQSPRTDKTRQKEIPCFIYLNVIFLTHLLSAKRKKYI